MKKIAKIFVCLLSAVFMFSLASCQQISDTINEVKKIAIEESLNILTNELQIENFELPECKTLHLALDYEEENDVSCLELSIVEPECELSEFKDDVVKYIEDAVKNNFDAEEIMDIISFEPEEVENGYRWEYDFTKTNENGEETEISIIVNLKDFEGDYVLGFEAIGVGNILSEVLEKLESDVELTNE